MGRFGLGLICWWFSLVRAEEGEWWVGVGLVACN
uniref:Uncharacterized protein n=1 Tax=Arundo donax TaxID=35708 RepID=A0A0A8Y5I4_ARUDO